MKSLKPFMLFTLLLWTSLVQAAGVQDPNKCIGSGSLKAPPENLRTKTDVDGNKVDTDIWIKFQKRTDWRDAVAYDCCPGLKLDGPSSECKDPSMTDNSLRYCNDDGGCGGDKGCFPLRIDDMFSTDSDDPKEIDRLRAEEGKFEEQMNLALGDSEPRKLGDACFRNLECDSYKCENMKCVVNKICRLGDKTEKAIGSVKCETPLEKDANSVCGDSKKPNYYTGKLKDLTVQQIGGQQCQFELAAKDPASGKDITPDQVKDAIKLSILTTRGMEYLYSKASLSDDDDCLWLVQYLRNEMKSLGDARKILVQKFNEDYLRIEKGFVALMKSEKGDMKEVKSPCGEFTTAHDIALRKATGIDFLCYLKKRNELFSNYESQMKAHMLEVQKVVKKYEDDTKDWKEDTKTFTIGNFVTKDYGDRGCRDFPKWHKIAKKRWSRKYLVRGNTDENKQVIDHGMIKLYLGHLNGDAEGNANADDFKARKYYLLDPLLPDVGFKDFGAGNEYFGLAGEYERQLGGGLSFTLNPLVAVTNGIMAIKNPAGYAAIYQKFKPNIINYISGMLPESKPADFIFDPEIGGTFAGRTCMENSASPTCKSAAEIQAKGGCLNNLDKPACKAFNDHLEDLQDVTFAQMLAYSQHEHKKYKHFFESNDTWRKHLWARYAIDLTNLDSYYAQMATLRKDENSCLDKVITQLRGNDFKGEGMGLNEGSANYYNQSVTNYKGANDKSKNYNAPKLTKTAVNPFEIKLSPSNKAFGGQGFTDSLLSKNDASGGGMNSAAGGPLAASMNRISEMNAKALASGANVKAREDELRKDLAARGNISSSGSGSNAAGNSSSKTGPFTGSGPISNKSSQDDMNSDKDKATSAHTSGAAGGANGGSKGGANAGGGSASGSMFGGLTSGSGSGSDSASGAGATGGDASGMSDEEKDMMSANYERSRSDYKTTEDDSLFQVLSKTYVRNLDKILTRKKKIDDGEPSAPTAP